MQRTSRLKRELHLLTTEPPQALCAVKTQTGWMICELIRFLTPIYHPNIDSAGRICLDVLRLPPKGAWRPSLNISTLLTSIQLLMSEPNPDDPLMADISSEYKYNKDVFIQNAKQWTEKYARQQKRASATPDEEVTQSEASTLKESAISQKRKGNDASRKGKKPCLDS